MINKVHLSRVYERFVTLRDHVSKRLGQRACGFYAGRTAADDHEVQCALLDELRSFGGCIQNLQNAAAQSFRIVHRVERKRVLSRSWRTEEVGLRARSKNQVVPGDHRSQRRSD